MFNVVSVNIYTHLSMFFTDVFIGNYLIMFRIHFFLSVLFFSLSRDSHLSFRSENINYLFLYQTERKKENNLVFIEIKVKLMSYLKKYNQIKYR